MTPRFLKVTLWSAVALLAIVGFTSSAGRGFSIFQSRAFSDGPVPEISPLDEENIKVVAQLLGIEPGSAEYREGEEQNRRFVRKFNQYPATTLLHVLPGAVFMVLAPLQFSRRIRSRFLQWHRWSGRVIVTLAIPIAFSGFFFGLLMPFSGAVEAAAIGLFGSLFVFSLVRAFIAIRQRDVATHREWMIRMFAVGIGVSSVRVAGTALALLTRQGPEAWFALSVWIGFSITSGLAEYWVHRTRRPRLEAAPIAIAGAV